MIPTQNSQRMLFTLKGGSLLVSDGEREGSDIFGFVKRCPVYLWLRYLVHNWYAFRVADEKI